jgi:hypothetical protein
MKNDLSIVFIGQIHSLKINSKKFKKYKYKNNPLILDIFFYKSFVHDSNLY